MAITKNALFSIEARGKAGPLVIEQRREGQYARAREQKKPPPSSKQKGKRLRYGQAVQAWRALTPEQKKVFDIKAKGKRMSGFNIFLKDFTTIWIIAIYGVGKYGVNRYG